MKQLLVVLAMTSCGLCSFVRPTVGQDQIYPLRGNTASGAIVEMSPDEVTIEVRGERRRIAVNEIRRIAFSDDPLELRRARDDVLAGQWENALDSLKRIDPARISREIVRRDRQYYLAYCQGKLSLSGGGDKAAAAATLLEFVLQDPKSHHFYEAAELLGDLAAALGEYENAQRYYAAIGRAPWPEYQMRSGLLEARVLVAQGNFGEAIAKCDRVLAVGVDTPDANRLKSLARVDRAVCLAETGKQEEGVTLLQDLLAKNDPQDAELFGRAYNALGRCHLRAKRSKDALMAYLHVDILFYAVADVHAESLYHLSKLWTELNRSDRALAAQNLLRERYAGSVWAKRS